MFQDFFKQLHRRYVYIRHYQKRILWLEILFNSNDIISIKIRLIKLTYVWNIISADFAEIFYLRNKDMRVLENRKDVGGILDLFMLVKVFCWYIVLQLECFSTVKASWSISNEKIPLK